MQHVEWKLHRHGELLAWLAKTSAQSLEESRGQGSAEVAAAADRDAPPGP